MAEYGYKVDMIGLAKKEEEVFKVGESLPHLLDRSSFALRLLQRVRDESHRFAITFHRNKRQKITSTLQNIDKIGAKTARNLMLHFKSLDNIANATLQELQQVVRKDQAEEIYKAYHGTNILANGQ
jgi:excinuclease ABC subunit C